MRSKSHLHIAVVVTLTFELQLEESQTTRAVSACCFRSHSHSVIQLSLSLLFFTALCLLQVLWWRHLYHHPGHRCGGDGAAAQWAQDNHHRSRETESSGLGPQNAGGRVSVPGPPHHQHGHPGRRHHAPHRYQTIVHVSNSCTAQGIHFKITAPSYLKRARACINNKVKEFVRTKIHLQPFESERQHVGARCEIGALLHH